MPDFAVRMTVKPAALAESDVAALREVGFKDADIMSIMLVTCLFNFMNRVASSLGVEVPLGFQQAVQGWLYGPANQQE